MKYLPYWVINELFTVQKSSLKDTWCMDYGTFCSRSLSTDFSKLHYPHMCWTRPCSPSHQCYFISHYGLTPLFCSRGGFKFSHFSSLIPGTGSSAFIAFVVSEIKVQSAVITQLHMNYYTVCGSLVRMCRINFGSCINNQVLAVCAEAWLRKSLDKWNYYISFHNYSGLFLMEYIHKQP